MSHVVKMTFPITDLDALEVAAREVGCELVRGQKTHRYYRDMRGNCEHAIRVTGNNAAYEIGLVRSGDGQHWELQADFYQGGKGLRAAVGEGCVKLHQHYNAELAARDRRAHGYRVNKQFVDGRVVIRATK